MADMGIELVCPICGDVMDWLEDTKEWICPDCGNRAFRDKSGQIYYEYE